MKNGLIILLSSFFLTSCLIYGDNTRRTYTALKETSCDFQSSEIHLFFEGEAIDFQYEKLGLIEIQGAEFDEEDKLISDLKHQAWKNCADGIIKIEQKYKLRNEGILFSDEPETTYSAKVYLGIAVRINKDEAFQSRYGAEAIALTDRDMELRRGF